MLSKIAESPGMTWEWVYKMLLEVVSGFFPSALLCEVEDGVGQALIKCDRKSYADECCYELML